MLLYGHEDWRLTLRHGFDGLLILRPHPARNGLANIPDRLFLVPALRNAAGQRGALGDDPSVLSGSQNDMQGHEFPFEPHTADSPTTNPYGTDTADHSKRH